MASSLLLRRAFHLRNTGYLVAGLVLMCHVASISAVSSSSSSPLRGFLPGLAEGIPGRPKENARGAVNAKCLHFPRCPPWNGRTPVTGVTGQNHSKMYLGDFQPLG